MAPTARRAVRAFGQMSEALGRAGEPSTPRRRGVGADRCGKVADMRVTFVASEAVPYAKTGGLADVVGSLPRALGQLGHEVAVILPYYPLLLRDCETKRVGPTLRVPVGKRTVAAEILEPPPFAGNVRFLLVKQPDFFSRAGLYVDDQGKDYPDNLDRFAFLSRAALEIPEALDFPVDLFHAHDWQTALAPIYLRAFYQDRPRYRETASVFTIHNLAYQGVFPTPEWPTVGLDRRWLNPAGLECYGQVCLLKGGIVGSDLFTTVSKTYAREIQTHRLGYGLFDVIQQNADRLMGIVNGIDYELWDPTRDAALAMPYGVQNWKEGKRSAKRQLRSAFGLPDRGDAPMLGMVSRIDVQKGFDLLGRIGDALLAEDVQFVLLGKGDPKLEAELHELQKRRPAKFAMSNRFDERLARLIYAGSDLFLMPSQFEPCGLAQLYSLRYGCLPVVRAVGGLADTVVDAHPRAIADDAATGFQFHRFAPLAFLAAIRRALHARESSPAVWDAMVERGMRQNWSWESSARHYEEAYARARRR